ncbi:hypothetical protein Esti_004139 [Eimeria stiedai]
MVLLLQPSRRLRRTPQLQLKRHLIIVVLAACWLLLIPPTVCLSFTAQLPHNATPPGPFELHQWSFTRSSPLKVRLVHRELSSEYSAYSPSDEGPPLGASTCAGRGGAQQQPHENFAYHLVFSYDPADLSKKDGGPFRYLEGQSVSFFVRDRRPGVPDEGPPKPRLYSLASSPLAPELGFKHSFSLCVRHHRYWGPDGERDSLKDGVCSSSLCTAALGSEFDVGAGPVGSSLLMPEDASVPLIFACTGTGVAPLRSFLRRLSVAPRAGPLVAYVGAGDAATAPYAREWGHLQNLLPPDNLSLCFAFSREVRNKHGGRLYVQDLIQEDGEKLLQLLAAGGIMYTCGRKDMVPPIKAALQAALGKSNVPFDSFFKQLIATKSEFEHDQSTPLSVDSDGNAIICSRLRHSFLADDANLRQLEGSAFMK